MRTTAELSKLTGVPKRTLQYWSQERKQNAKGQEVGGAGILPSTVNPENGYRTFSDDALSRVLLIMLAKEAGCGQAEIQDVMSALSCGACSPLAKHIEKLGAEKEGLARKIRLAHSVESAWQLLPSDGASLGSCRNASADSSLLLEVAALAVMEFLESLSRHVPDLPPDVLADATREWLAEGGYGAMLLELLIGQGAVGAVEAAIASSGNESSE